MHYTLYPDYLKFQHTAIKHRSMPGFISGAPVAAAAVAAEAGGWAGGRGLSLVGGLRSRVVFGGWVAVEGCLWWVVGDAYIWYKHGAAKSGSRVGDI